MGTYVDRVYGDFVAGLVINKVTFLGKPMHIDGRMENGKHERFLHAITENPEGSSGEGARNVSILRCERVSWIPAILGAAPSARVKVWTDNSRSRGREIRYSAALSDCSYVIHLAERSGYMHFITAYPVEYPRRREKFLDQWKQSRFE